MGIFHLLFGWGGAGHKGIGNFSKENFVGHQREGMEIYFRGRPHIDAVYIVQGIRVYHVSNVPAGQCWTWDRDAYPHFSHTNSRAITELVPDSAYQRCVFTTYSNHDDGEFFGNACLIAENWNTSDLERERLENEYSSVYC